MRAGDLAAPFPTIGADAAAVDAARLLAARNLPGLIVVDARDRPFTILAGTQVLRMAVPRYIQDDPPLARVVDEGAADAFIEELGSRTVAELLPEQQRELPVVDEAATALEIAALMARTRTPLVAVVDGNGVLIGAVTLGALLDRLVGT